MENGKLISDDGLIDNGEPLVCNDSFMRHVGYKENTDCIRRLYNPKNIKTMSKNITKLLTGVDPQNRHIVVPNSTICSVMSDIYDSYRPATGDIFSRYTIPTENNFDSYVQEIITQTIEVITSDVRNNLETEENNRKLTIWTTVYGDFNAHQLRQHAPIKVLNKRPNPMEFHMRY